MSKDTIISGVLIEETTTFSFVEVCKRYHIPQELLQEMIEQGLFNLEPTALHFAARDLQKIESAFRLHTDLGVNLPGVALALDLLEELDRLRQELEILRRQCE